MDREEQFDSFYLETRAPLLLSTFALTGDLSAAHVAVREAYAVAWQHWRKTSALEDPLTWVRPRAWQRARRRHNARLWRRHDKSLSASQGDILDALAHIPLSRRKTLVLTHLVGLHEAAAAHELGVPLSELEAANRDATTAFAATLDIDPAAIGATLGSLAAGIRASVLPRATSVRRTGSKRRHTHTAVAAAAVAVVGIASAAFVYQPSQPTPEVGADKTPPAVDTTSREVTEKPEDDLPSPGDLLDEDQITRLGLDQEWRISSTDDNTQGKGINTTCQDSRFADPDGVSALVRTFQAKGSQADRSAVQTIEVSESAGQARKAFATTVGWYAGCQVGRLQLLNAYRVGNIGDQAQVLMVRAWKKPVTTYSVAVARTGRFVTSTVGKTVGAEAAPPGQITQSLADAVSMLCSMSGSNDCSETPTFAVVPPPPSGEERGVLAVADLPPVGRIEKPWVGTDARPARDNPSATVCDRADFAAQGASRTRTRTFLIPGAKLPDRFGLSEAYGDFRSYADAGRFLGTMRTRINRCEKGNPAAQVSPPRTVHETKSPTDSTLWDVRTEISDEASVLFRIGFVRVGTTVAQVTFSPTADEDVTPAQFDALIVRTADRLRELG